MEQNRVRKYMHRYVVNRFLTKMQWQFNEESVLFPTSGIGITGYPY